MRSGPTEATGTSGQSFLKGIFEELGWAVVPNPDHDLGTDLWVNPRDQRRFDLGLMLGVQVKNGPSWFARPGGKDGQIGWWHRNDRAHFNYWLQHTVPHIVVLRDPDTGLAYWAHVSKDTVEWTGKNGKIFVPAHHVVDEKAASVLVDIAASVRPTPHWSGTAWTGTDDLTPTTELRYALLAPRLVAPHPNAPRRQLKASEAIAVMAAGRFGELDRFGLGEGGETRSGWDWGLYAAILEFAVSGSVSGLRDSAAEATDPHERAVASVALATALVEGDAFEEALEVIASPLDADECDPIDQAWLQVHRARCLAEIGDPAGASQLAVEVQGLPRLHPDDVTAAAIAGSGASLVFRNSDLFDGDVGATIMAGDTETTWWRSQAISWGLGSLFDETFRRWGDTSNEITFTRDRGESRLRGVSLVAGFTASHEGWCHATSLLAKWTLMSPNLDSATACGCLMDLCRAGDSKGVAAAVQQLLISGPASAITQAGALINLDRVTRTSARASLELLTRGADVLPVETADAAAEWALRSPGSLTAWSHRVRPTFAVDWQRAGLLRALVEVVSPATLARIRKYVVDLPPLSDQGDAHRWAAVVAAIPPLTWTEDEVQALVLRSGDNWELIEAITSLDARRGETRREDLHDQLRAGSLQALAHIESMASVPEEAVDPLIAACADSIRHRLAHAHSGVFAPYAGVDPGDALVLLNVNFPQHANWEPILDLLTDPLPYKHIVGRAVDAIERAAEEIDAETASRLADALKGLIARAPLPVLPLLGGDARTSAAAALNALQPVTETPYSWLAVRGRSERQQLIRLLAHRADPADTAILLTMAAEPDPHVRASAAAALSYWITRGVSTEAALDGLTHILTDDTTLAARWVANQWPNEPNQYLGPLAELLASHISAQARSKAKIVLTGSGTSTELP